MKKTFALLLCSAVLLSSCATAKYFSGFKPGDAEGKMALLGPVSTQFYIDKDGQEAYSETLSIASEEMLADLTVKMGVPVDEIFPLDSLLMEETVGFVRYLQSSTKKRMGEAPIPAALDELLEEHGYRYGLLLYADGMSRDKGEFVKKAVAGAFVSVVIAVATLGMIVPYAVPTEYSSAMYTAVLDTETNRVVFYNHSGPRETHPLKEKPVRSQLADLYRDFLYRR